MPNSLQMSPAGLYKMHKPDSQSIGTNTSQSPSSMQTHIEVVKLIASRYIQNSLHIMLLCKVGNYFQQCTQTKVLAKVSRRHKVFAHFCQHRGLKVFLCQQCQYSPSIILITQHAQAPWLFNTLKEDREKQRKYKSNIGKYSPQG